jgi:hypothetical protein
MERERDVRDFDFEGGARLTSPEQSRAERLLKEDIRVVHVQVLYLDARAVMREADIPARIFGRLVVALVPMPGKLKFDEDWLEWFFLMHDEAAVNDDVFVYLSARTVQHIRNETALDRGPQDEKAIEDRLGDIQKAASRKFDRGEFVSTVMHSNRIIKISPADLDD